MTTIPAIEGLPELVAEMFLEPNRSDLCWSEWRHVDGTSVRHVQADGYSFSYSCPTSSLNQDGEPSLEGILCRGLDDDHRDFEVTFFKEDGHILVFDGRCRGRYQQGEDSYDFLAELILSVRALCCGLERRLQACA